MSTPAIKAQSLQVSFGSQQILRDVDLEIGHGECLVVIGPSGQGKTTLLKTLAGLIDPQDGEVLIESKNLKEVKGTERLKLLQKTGMLFQKNALFDSLSCGENVAFPLREATSLSEKEIQEKVEYFLEAVGLSHALALFPDEISGGMQKRLGIARALALQPEIVFYDDPTAGLDPITSRKIIQLILDLRKKNKSTIVAVTNDMHRAYQLADRIAFVEGKKVLITGSVAETKTHSDPRVRQFILGLAEGPLSLPSLGQTSLS